MSIELPISAPPALPAPAAAAAGPETAAGTVLVVEDEPALRQVIARTLRRDGLEVLTAADGDEAVRIARAEHVDVLVSDVVMPGPSGPETAAAIQQLQPHVTAVFISGHTPEVIENLAMVGVLRKPFRQEELVTTVRRALAARPAAGSAA